MSDKTKAKREGQKPASGSLTQTTSQSLGSLLKSARDITRKDKGLNRDLDRLQMLTWIMFFKFVGDLKWQREEQAKVAGSKFNAPPRTRRERADRLKREAKDFFDKFRPEARAVLNDLLDKYTEHGATQFQFPDALKIPPISNRGSVSEIAGYFGGPNNLRTAVNELQTMLYAA